MVGLGLYIMFLVVPLTPLDSSGFESTGLQWSLPNLAHVMLSESSRVQWIPLECVAECKVLHYIVHTHQVAVKNAITNHPTMTLSPPPPPPHSPPTFGITFSIAGDT